MLVLKEQEQQKKKENLIYEVQGKEGSYWVQRQSDPHLFCHVQVTRFGIQGDCPDAVYRKRPCKHCKWVIERDVKAGELN